MLIDAIELFHLRLPATDTVLVRLASGTQSGWGEACVGREPVESPEWAGGVFACLRDFLAPVVRGQSIISGDQLQELVAKYQGNAAAKSALDCAWWDLQAKTHATTVSKMLGGAREMIETCITLDVMPTIDDLVNHITALQLTGAVIVLKFRPGWDEQMLRAVRQMFPTVPLAIDCDGCCQLGQREMLYRLDDFMLRWIEQPFSANDLVAHAMLQETIRTPICLHQSITSLDRAEQAIDLGSCKLMKLDPTLIGGLTPTRAVYESCLASKLPLAVGGKYATPAGRAALTALASLEGFSLAAEIGEEVAEKDRLLETAIDRVVL